MVNGPSRPHFRPGKRGRFEHGTTKTMHRGTTLSGLIPIRPCMRREAVPHELFATYWRDVHGPLCARIPGLGWYVQNHFNREQDAHLWPSVEGVTPFPNYVLDGGVEIGFSDAADQAVFKAASPLLFSDEQNMFAETIAYDLPQGSRTVIDLTPDPVPNETDQLDRIHVHFNPAHDDIASFHQFMAGEFAVSLAAAPEVLRLRLHLPTPYDNAQPNPQRRMFLTRCPRNVQSWRFWRSLL